MKIPHNIWMKQLERRTSWKRYLTYIQSWYRTWPHTCSHHYICELFMLKNCSTNEWLHTTFENNLNSIELRMTFWKIVEGELWVLRTPFLLQIFSLICLHQKDVTKFVRPFLFTTGVKVINQKHTIFHNYILFISSTFMYSHLNIHRVWFTTCHIKQVSINFYFAFYLPWQVGSISIYQCLKLFIIDHYIILLVSLNDLIRIFSYRSPAIFPDCSHIHIQSFLLEPLTPNTAHLLL